MNLISTDVSIRLLCLKISLFYDRQSTDNYLGYYIAELAPSFLFHNIIFGILNKLIHELIQSLYGYFWLTEFCSELEILTALSLFVKNENTLKVTK